MAEVSWRADYATDPMYHTQLSAEIHWFNAVTSECKNVENAYSVISYGIRSVRAD